jgi:uncharacterized membrane protein
LQRIVLSLAMAGVAFLLTRNSGLDKLVLITLLWDVFAITFITCCFIVFFTRPVAEIILQANKEDGSKLFVMISTLVSAFAAMLAVLLLIISKDLPANQKIISIVCSVAGMLFSWILVHTIFTFHYAHMYYDEGGKATGLDFPEEKKPDYIDFAYFSFVIGMTFQVSDVQITSRSIRRTALAHALLAFALNTFVVALTINLIAGLKN